MKRWRSCERAAGLAGLLPCPGKRHYPTPPAHSAQGVGSSAPGDAWGVWPYRASLHILASSTSAAHGLARRSPFQPRSQLVGLSFADEVRRESSLSPWSENIKYKTAIFRQVNRHNPRTHHDALEFPDGEIVLLTLLKPDPTVLQLPASTSGNNGVQRAEEPAMAR